jgi:hypothetical protein
MKSNVISFIFGITISLLISSSAINSGILTVVPTKPKSYLVKSFSNYNQLTICISNYTKNGYVVNNLEAYEGVWVLVMYKY